MHAKDTVLPDSIRDRAKCLRVEDNILFCSIQIIQHVAVISLVLVVVFVLLFVLVLVLDHNLNLLRAVVVLVCVR